MIDAILFLLIIILFVRLSNLEIKIVKLGKSGYTTKPDLAAASVETKPLAAVAPSVSPPSSLAVAASPASSHDFETKFGGQIFTAVGALAVILGIGFFLKYAFDNNLISESARVLMGIASGLILVGLGEWLRHKYDSYGQMLAGLGLGIMYLSIFASFNFYKLIDQPSAFIGMLVVTAMGIAFSLRANSQALVLFSQLGGLLTPLLLSNGQNQPHELFGYLVLLDLVMLVLSFFKSWPVLNIVSLGGTGLLYVIWYANNYSADQFALALAYASIFFGIFFAVTLLHQFRLKGKADEMVNSFALINAFGYFVLSYVLINPLYQDWMGLFTLMLGALYVLVALISPNDEQNDDYKFLYLAISAVFFFVAVPIQLKHFWITLVWALEAAALLMIGFRLNSRQVRIFAHLVFAAAVARLLIWDSWSVSPDLAWQNTRFIVSVIMAGLAGAGALAYSEQKDKLEAGNSGGAFMPRNEYGLAIAIFLLESFLLLFLAFTWEVRNHYPSYWLPVAWASVSLLAGWIALKLRSFAGRAVASAGFALVALRLLFVDSSLNIRTYTPIANHRVGVYLFVIGLGMLYVWLLSSNKDKISEQEGRLTAPAFTFSMGILGLALISAEVLDYFNQIRVLTGKNIGNVKNSSLSVAWTLYAVLLLILGIARKSAAGRLFAIALFAVVVFKVFLYDTVSLNNFYRFVSYITLGVILLLAGYLYNRYKERIINFIKI